MAARTKQTKRDYYDILGVAHNAEPAEIRAAYHQLAKKFHPDRNQDPEAVDRFKEIAEAYAILSDHEKRGRYDRGGFAGVADISPEELFGGMDFGSLFGRHGFETSFDLGGGGLFDRFFGHRRQSGQSKGANTSVEVQIPLIKVNSGTAETIHSTHPVKCAICHGTGAAPGTEKKTCETCHGSGQHVQRKESSKDGYSVRQITSCATCDGSGHIIETPCAACGGRGETLEEETYTVQIPAGIPEGARLRIPGKGRSSAEPGGEPGDLLVVVRSIPDPRFERRGADLFSSETLSAVDLTLGTQLDVATLDGDVTVTVPPGTQPGTVLRVKAHGLAEYGTANRGSLLIVVHVEIPTDVSPEERRLYEQLRDLRRLRELPKEDGV